jgi:lipopolysaccharide cholinephosphotransferase
VTPHEVRKVQLEVLAALDRHCREHGLTYYLGYGTLLGAVRHGGFIPWDDDVDVMMPRDDYERLVDTFAAAAPTHLSLGSQRTQAGWPLPYAKVSDDRTVLVEPFEVPVAMGVNVDVFPLDPVPSGPLGRRVQAALLRRLGWALELRYIAAERGRGWHGEAAIRLGKPVLRLVPMRLLVGMLSRCARWSGRGDRVGVRVGSSDWSVPPSSLGVPVVIGFEGLGCLAPADADDVLTAMYGDYRTLPPDSQRLSHHAFTAHWKR